MFKLFTRNEAFREQLELAASQIANTRTLLIELDSRSTAFSRSMRGATKTDAVVAPAELNEVRARVFEQYLTLGPVMKKLEKEHDNTWDTEAKKQFQDLKRKYDQMSIDFKIIDKRINEIVNFTFTKIHLREEMGVPSSSGTSSMSVVPRRSRSAENLTMASLFDAPPSPLAPGPSGEKMPLQPERGESSGTTSSKASSSSSKTSSSHGIEPLNLTEVRSSDTAGGTYRVSPRFGPGRSEAAFAEFLDQKQSSWTIQSEGSMGMSISRPTSATMSSHPSLPPLQIPSAVDQEEVPSARAAAQATYTISARANATHTTNERAEATRRISERAQPTQRISGWPPATHMTSERAPTPLTFSKGRWNVRTRFEERALLLAALSSDEDLDVVTEMTQHRQRWTRRSGSRTPPQPQRGGSHSPRQPQRSGSHTPPQPQRSGSHTPPQPQRRGSHTPPQPQRSGSHTPPQPQRSGSHTPPQPQRSGSRSPPQPQRSGSHTPPQPQRSGSHTPPQPQRSGSRNPPQPQRSGSRSPPHTQIEMQPLIPGSQRDENAQSRWDTRHYPTFVAVALTVFMVLFFPGLMWLIIKASGNSKQ